MIGAEPAGLLSRDARHYDRAMTPFRNRRVRAFLLSCAMAAGTAVLIAGPAGAAQPGDLDPHFGHKGTVVGDHVGGEGIFILSTGGFLVTGSGEFKGAARWIITKWTPKGKPDKTFGGGDGLATFSIPGFDFVGGTAVARVAKGKIVVGGNACDANGVCDFAAARLKKGGRLDHTFGGGDGVVTTDFFGSDDILDGMAVRPKGQIVLLGDAKTASGDFDLGLVQYRKNGTPDPSFGTGGKVAQPLGTNGFWETVALGPGGRVIVGGTATGPGGTADFAVGAFTKAGTLDSSFGSGGVATADFANDTDTADALLVGTNGSILAGGIAGLGGGGFAFGLARFTSTGLPDTGFGGGDGLVTTDLGPFYDRIDGLALQSDGKIVAGGRSDFDANDDSGFAVARYLPGGSLDTGFGTGGFTRTNLTSAEDQPDFQCVGVEPSGRIVLSGFTRSDTGATSVLLGYVG
jgi:uncharacterized delta-60 repeat protein